MSISLIDAIRINKTTWGWSSVLFSVDGQSSDGLVAADWEEQLEARVVPSNVQDQTPLGMSQGVYRVGRFPLRMLADSARAFKNYLQAKAATVPSGSYGQATFDMVIQLSGADAPDLTPTTTAFSTCRVVGEKRVHDQGAGAAVTEFAIACLAIAQDGTSLFNALGTSSLVFPAVDTITVAGGPAPGKWTLVRGSKVYGWQERKGFGQSGATVVPTGDELVKPEFHVEFFDPKDWLLFQAFRAQYLKKALVGVPGAPGALALGIDHPELKALGCTSVVVQEVEAFKNDGFGVWAGNIKFLQYRPPQLALSKPDSAIPDLISPRPTAQDALEAKIQALLAQNQARAAQ